MIQILNSTAYKECLTFSLFTKVMNSYAIFDERHGKDFLKTEIFGLTQGSRLPPEVAKGC